MTPQLHEEDIMFPETHSIYFCFSLPLPDTEMWDIGYVFLRIIRKAIAETAREAAEIA